MRTTLLVVAVLFSLPAFATGERVRLGVGAGALRDTLCISMNCVTDGSHDVVVTTRPGRGGVEVVVTTAGGAVKLVERATLTRDGRFSSTEVVRLTSRVVKAIEGPSTSSRPELRPRRRG